VLDPIDGTKSFSRGALLGTLIALLHHGQPVLGVIHQPVLKATHARRRHDDDAHGKAVRTRAGARIENATLLTSDPFNPAKYQKRGSLKHWPAAQNSRHVGRLLGYLLLASGYATDARPDHEPWDIAALVR